jgi:hypothetical protein
VDGDGDVVAESMVVQDVDGEEQDDIDEPAADGDAVRSEEEGGTAWIELRDVAGSGNEDELDKGQERPWEKSARPWKMVRRACVHTAFGLDLDNGFQSKDLW